MTKVHGFKNKVVSDFLKDRYPYLENQNTKKQLQDEVCKSHHYYLLENMYKVFKNPHNNDEQFQEALLILNEYSNHQEQKVQIIQHGFVDIVEQMLQRKNEDVVHEALRLLGSLCSVKLGRSKLSKNIVKSFKQILVYSNLQNKEVLCWALLRIVSGRDGVSFLIQNYFVESMIQAFVNHSKKLEQKNLKILKYLLNIFQEILQEDIAIMKFTCNNVFQKLLDFLDFLHKNPDEFLEERIDMIILSLNCLSFMTMNNDGKEEGIRLQAIKKLQVFFDNKNPDIINPIIRTYMFLSIMLEGKKQIIECEDDFIIKKLIEFMSISEDIDTNVCIVFQNVSENEKGFKIIMNYLSTQPQRTLDIFGNKVVIPIEKLLRQYRTPEAIRKIEDLQKIQQYISPILFVVNPKNKVTIDKDQFFQFTLQNTTKFVSSLLSLLVIRKNQKLTQNVVLFIQKLIDIDEKNIQFLKKRYQEIKHSYCEFFENCLEDEIHNYPMIQSYVK